MPTISHVEVWWWLLDLPIMFLTFDHWYPLFFVWLIFHKKCIKKGFNKWAGKWLISLLYYTCLNKAVEGLGTISWNGILFHDFLPNWTKYIVECFLLNVLKPETNILNEF